MIILQVVIDLQQHLIKNLREDDPNVEFIGRVILQATN